MIAVVLSLLFVAFEIQQNTAQMRAEAAYSVHQDVQRLNEAIYQDADLADIITRAEQSFETLDLVDRRQARAYYFSLILPISLWDCGRKEYRTSPSE